MARYYTGDIRGKFACGVQSSDTMDKFGAVSVDSIKYKCCYCDYIENEDYCKVCYESKEEHINYNVDEEEDDPDVCFADYRMLESEMTMVAFAEYGCPFLRQHTELYFKAFIGQIDVSDLADDELEIYYDMEMLMKILTFFEENDETICRWRGEL